MNLHERNVFMNKAKKAGGSVLLSIFKRIPFILLITSANLIFIASILPDFLTENLGYIMLILWVISFVSLFFIRKEQNGDYSLIKMAFWGKLALIPWFILIGISILVLFLGGVVIPINWIVLPVFFILDFFMLAITSLYASFGISAFYRRNQMPFKIILIVLQWFFVIDVISIIVAFTQSKHKHKAMQLKDECH